MILQDESRSRFNKKQAIALWSFGDRFFLRTTEAQRTQRKRWSDHFFASRRGVDEEEKERSHCRDFRGDSLFERTWHV
ncbi:hypothetical protein H1Q63_04165 [Desmonostoc muscorum CCALA 125]|nr:hypothetical protein [Desmonostoc muscorum CCALA 125]